MTIDPAIIKAVHSKVHQCSAHLADGNYQNLVYATQGRYLSADQLRGAVDAIGRPLVPTPKAEWPHIRISPTPGTDPVEYDFMAPLWVEGGRAGIALHGRLIPAEAQFFDFEIVEFVPIDATLPPDVAAAPPEVPRPIEYREPGPGDRELHPVPPRWRPPLEAIIRRLVARDYTGLLADGLIYHATGPDDLSFADDIHHYPDTLTDFPERGWDYTRYHPWVNLPHGWSVWIPMWTTNQGFSDLVLQATIIDDGTTPYAYVDMIDVP